MLIIQRSGVLTNYSALKTDNPFIQTFGTVAGVTEIVGGKLYAIGAWGPGQVGPNAALMRYGSWLSRYGGGAGLVVVSGYNLYHDIENGNVENAVGSAGATGTGLAVLAGNPAAAATLGLFTVTYAVGQEFDKAAGWSDALANRAIEHTEIYRDLGFGETTSEILAAPSNVPVISDVGEGLGWGLSRLVLGVTDENYTYNPFEMQWTNDAWDEFTSWF